MNSSLVIIQLDIFNDIVNGSISCFIVLIIRQLILPCGAVLLTREAFYRSVVGTIAFTAHSSCKPILLDDLVILITTVLTASIRMHNQCLARSFISRVANQLFGI